MGAISQLENRGADTKIRFTAPHICIPAFCAQNALQMKSTLLFQVLYHPNAIRKPGSNLQIKTSFLQPPLCAHDKISRVWKTRWWEG